MAFTTWTALRTAIKDALADHIATGEPMIGSFSMGDRTFSYRSYEELKKLLGMTYELEALESSGASSSTKAYSRHRRFP